MILRIIISKFFLSWLILFIKSSAVQRLTVRAWGPLCHHRVSASSVLCSPDHRILPQRGEGTGAEDRRRKLEQHCCYLLLAILKARGRKGVLERQHKETRASDSRMSADVVFFISRELRTGLGPGAEHVITSHFFVLTTLFTDVGPGAGSTCATSEVSSAEAWARAAPGAGPAASSAI